MYAVIRAGGKQYRVAPGDVVKVEKLPAMSGDSVKFDVVAVSGDEGSIAPAKDAVVSAQVVESGRAGKILVFHYKRKKQYKKMYGHRQPFTAVRITEISFNGQRFTAPELPAKKVKKAAPAPAEAAEATASGTAAKKSAAPKKSAAKKSVAKKPAEKKAEPKGKKK